MPLSKMQRSFQKSFGAIKNQSEFKLTLDDYLARMVNENRIARGREMHKKYPSVLNRVRHKYGVQPQVILAFLGNRVKLW